VTIAAPPPHDPAAALDTGLRPLGTALAVSPHHLASNAGIDVMARGGSAVDAAIAVNAVLGVVLPDTCGVGGDLFALVYVPGEPAPTALNASGRAGSGATAADLRDAGHVEVPLRSPWSVTVPGCVDGWEALHARYGSLPFADLLEPAISLAQEGFAVSRELANSLHRIRPLIGSQPSAPALYPHGSIPDFGDILRRPHLADTLRSVADAGREAFYAGLPGAGIAAATEGMITAADLEERQAEWVEPIALDVFGLTGWTIPPNSQGYLTLAAAFVFEQLSAPRGLSAPSVHAAIESYRAMAWERDAVVSDPASAPIPAAELVGRSELSARAAEINMDAAGTWPKPKPAPGGTAFMGTLDGSGMGVSLIQSNFHGIGSGLSAGATGVFLHNRGAGFCLDEGHPNELAPGKRPLHTLAPSIWTGDGGLHAILGTRGGQYQPQLLLQIAANLWWHGMEAPEALAAPRWVSDGWSRDDSSRVQVEGRTPCAIREGLEARGHAVHTANEWEQGWGPVSLITADGSAVRGLADPRVSTTAASSTSR
jgi:gamma-glutamyltranspeptidase/glutathione hydrolase